MVLDTLALMGKGLLAVMAAGVFLTIMLALWHTQNYVRRNYPRVHAWGGRITVTLVIVVVIGIILLAAGVFVETFFHL